MNFGEMLNQMFAKWEEEEIKELIQVTCLKPEDITRVKAYDSDTAEIEGRADVLIAKIRALQSDLKARHIELWEHLHSTYNLPRNGSYRIREGKIWKKPKPVCGGDDAIKVCFCGECK